MTFHSGIKLLWLVRLFGERNCKSTFRPDPHEVHFKIRPHDPVRYLHAYTPADGRGSLKPAEFTARSRNEMIKRNERD